MENTEINNCIHNSFKSMFVGLEGIQEAIEEVCEKLDILFYPGNTKSDVNQIVVKDEIQFVNFGIVLFKKYEIVIVDGKPRIRLNGTVSEDEISNLGESKTLGIIVKNLNLIGEILQPYIEVISKNGSVFEEEYSAINGVVEKFVNMDPGKFFTINFNPARMIPSINSLIGSCEGSITIEKNLIGEPSFTYEFVITKNDELSIPGFSSRQLIFKEQTLPSNRFEEFILEFYKNGVLIE